MRDDDNDDDGGKGTSSSRQRRRANKWQNTSVRITHSNVVNENGANNEIF